MARSAYDALRRLHPAQTGRKDAVPGGVASIQTFGSYLNFHPHVHAVVTEGVVAPDGTFLPIPALDLGAVCDFFGRLVLAGLRRAERLSEEFHDLLLAWSPSGFSVHGALVAHVDEPERLERLARYVTRAPFAVDRVQQTPEGRVRVETPPDPASGSTVLDLDPLEFVHRVTTQSVFDGRRTLAAISCGTTDRTPRGPAAHCGSGKRWRAPRRRRPQRRFRGSRVPRRRRRPCRRCR